MTKYFMLLLVIVSCGKPATNQSVTLLTGLSLNPNEKRFGIEITPDTIFYCIEKSGGSKTYDYFQYTSSTTLVNDLSKGIKTLFVYNYGPLNMPDATPYQLILQQNDSIFLNKKFVASYLDEEQLDLIQQILNLKKMKMTRIEHHHFKGELLTEELPFPPHIPLSK